MVDNSELTTISELTPLVIYTVRVQAFTSMGAGPMSNPVKVKTQQGVPSQPSSFRATEIGETEVVLQWTKPTHSSENIVHYELYWNDTYANEAHHKYAENEATISFFLSTFHFNRNFNFRRRIANTETYKLTGLYPDTLYYVWLAARSQRGEGATTPPIPVRTKQYGKILNHCVFIIFCAIGVIFGLFPSEINDEVKIQLLNQAKNEKFKEKKTTTTSTTNF